MSVEAVLERGPLAPVARQARSESHRILIADDQQDVIEALRLLLSGHDFDVQSAQSPADALTLADNGAFDAALIDLNYEPGRTSGDQGLDLITALLRRMPSLPIVVMTAWSSIDLALEAVRRGARDFIEKPWDESRMLTMMRSQAELGAALRRCSTLERENQELQLTSGTADNGVPLLNTMKLFDVESVLVRHAMEMHQGNVSRAARTLGLSRSALYRRLERHGIV